MKLHSTILMLVAIVFATACNAPQPKRKAVFMLLDVSGTYTKEIGKAAAVSNYLLGTLSGGDSLAVAKIDSGSFNEKDVIAKATFDTRPSTSNLQKRQFKDQVDAFVGSAKPSKHTDINGAILQASVFLNEAPASSEKYILVFSDLEEDLVKGYIRKFDFPLDQINVVALNVTKLNSDNVDPRDYLKRLDAWEQRVTTNGGNWRVVNDLEQLGEIFAGGRGRILP